MKVEQFHIYKYALPLIQPLTLHGETVDAREGLIIRLVSRNGVEGYGEAAPLPGFSRDSYNQALDHARLLKDRFAGGGLPDKLLKFDGQFGQILDQFQLSPSARFGFESAVLQLLANGREEPMYKCIPDIISHKTRLAGLLSGTKQQVANQARRLVDQGYTELKLKVGGDIAEDVDKVRAVNEATFGKVLLHLDANQRWNYDQALEFGKTIGCAAASYIEEPFKDYRMIPDFFDQTMIPIALDESLNVLSVDEIKSISGVETLVIKPTVIGGIERSLQLMKEAQHSALNAVISSSFESSVGLWTLASMIGSGHNSPAAGLDTLKWFKTDLLKTPIIIEAGAIDLEQDPVRSSNINFSLLTET